MASLNPPPILKSWLSFVDRVRSLIESVSEPEVPISVKRGTVVQACPDYYFKELAKPTDLLKQAIRCRNNPLFTDWISKHHPENFFIYPDVHLKATLQPSEKIGEFKLKNHFTPSEPVLVPVFMQMDLKGHLPPERTRSIMRFSKSLGKQVHLGMRKLLFIDEKMPNGHYFLPYLFLPPRDKLNDTVIISLGENQETNLDIVAHELGHSSFHSGFGSFFWIGLHQFAIATLHLQTSEIIDDSNYYFCADRMGHPNADTERFASAFFVYLRRADQFNRYLQSEETPNEMKLFGKALWVKLLCSISMKL